MSTEDQPDGKLFRKANEVIQTSEKVIHRGDESEEEITNDLSKLVAEMNNPNIPSLPKCFLAHYYFEYIHPFYDGNGRTGRFIVCSYLSRKLDRMSALQFSTAIAKNRNSYYKAFVEMSNVYNQGEGTKFVIKMMQLLIFGQYNIIDKLDNGIKLLENAKRLIAKLKLNSNEKEIMFALCQKAIFGPYVGTITDTDLSNTLKISRYLLNKAFEVLIANDFVEVASSKPLSHVITKKIRDQLFCLETFL
ncbi:Fic family protein [Xylocopilactobacillus apicola]|uniref:Fic family protein n=1 Tax=Xylocopilactobacillus apicola TaxID=2932184 RepID=UPI003CE47A19